MHVPQDWLKEEENETDYADDGVETVQKVALDMCNKPKAKSEGDDIEDVRENLE